jgi:PAS domain S-box-containing protein
MPLAADCVRVTWLELRLPPATSVPNRAANVVRDHVNVRFGLFLAAWFLLALLWFDWHAFILQMAIASVVLWYAVRRERLLRAVDGKRVQLELVTAVAAATEDASDVEELLERATGEICRQSQWPFGQVWLVDEAGELQLARAWHARDEERFRKLRHASANVSFRAGEGLPEKVLQTRTAVWTTGTDLVRGTDLGVGVGFAFPVNVDGEVAAILEFFSPDDHVRDDALVATLAHLTGQLGEIVKRTRAEAQTRATEERMRSLIETLPLATYIDRPGEEDGTTWVSPQMAGITSYEAEEWAADPGLFRKVLHPDDRERVVRELTRVKETGEPLDHEYRMIRRDGSVVWLHDLAVTIRIHGTRYTRGFIVDVTARREAELERDQSLAQLQEHNEQLRELDGLKDEFVALVSHELRTPLTSIRGYLELMIEDTNLTAEQLHFMQTIDRNAVRLQRVVGDLLFLAQVEAGKLTLELGEVDVNSIVADALEAASPAAQSKSIELRAETTALPPIPGDRARLAQVLDNFVSNAIKFTSTGGRVLVATSLRDDAIEVRVSDTGVGISAQELPQLFHRFFRTQTATSQAIPGTGLGLAIAKAIVEGHGGEIAVQSQEGSGTTFTFRLPRN